MYRLRIELMSDLCAASGDGYASIIDTDVVTDQNGIPFIPARRLKGCLREASCYINTDKDVIDSIFGVTKDIKSGSLRLGDAMLEEYAQLVTQTNGFSAKYVTELFTNESACTAIGADGSVMENTLRFVRVVDRKLPWDQNRNIVFFSDVTIDERYVHEFERICRSLRHIGYKRTRGFGAIRCSLEKSDGDRKFIIDTSKLLPGKEYRLDYAIRLDEDLMLPGSSADRSMDHISGQAVIGMLAGAYLKEHPADTAFDQLFLSGNVRCSDLYITDDALTEYIPVPATFGKRKGMDKIIDLTDETTRNGTEKPLKKGYMSGNLKMCNVETEVVFHNSRKERTLYTQLCICKGQRLRGSIICEYDKMLVVADIINRNDIAFGRSKSAQYSKCTVIAAEISELQATKIKAEKDDIVIFSFESDAVISDEYGNVSPSIDSVISALGVTGEVLPVSSLKYRTLSGYLSIMRMQRPHIRAVSAGSAVAVRIQESCELDTVMYIGERQGEGYGKIRVFRQNELSLSMSSNLVPQQGDVSVDHMISDMLRKIKDTDEMHLDAVEFARSYRRKFLDNWNPAFVGRVTLMVEESVDLIDLSSRIKSIKSVKKRKAVDDLIKHSESSHYHDWITKKKYLLLILQLAKYMVKQGGKINE